MSSSPSSSSLLTPSVLPERGIYFGDVCFPFLRVHQREVLSSQMGFYCRRMSTHDTEMGPGETGDKSQWDCHAFSQYVCANAVRIFVDLHWFWGALSDISRRREWWREGLDGLRTTARQPLRAVSSDIDGGGLARDEWICARVRVCLYVFFYILHSKDQGMDFTSKVRTFWLVLMTPKCLLEEYVLVWRVGVRTRIWM